jgi:hypothetical protein
MIEIKALNRKLLLEYIDSYEYKNGSNIPISIHRAISQTKNPAIDDEDILLLLAINDTILVGYLGILPVIISFRTGKKVKIGWLSSLWVSPNFRGTDISNKLIKQAFQLYNKNILLSDFVPKTKKTYDKTKLFENKPLSKDGIRLYIQSDLQTILPPKKAYYAKIIWVLQFLDLCINSLIYFRFIFSKINNSQSHFEYITSIDDETEHFIANNQVDNLFKRSKENLDWIFHNPWVISAPQKDNFNSKYYFSSTAQNFEYHSVKIRNSDGNIIAFMILAKRNGNLKIPFLYHNNCINAVIESINQHILTWKIKTFSTFHPELTQGLFQCKTPAFYKRKIKREYLTTLNGENSIVNITLEFQDGDGDCCFT